MRDRVWGLVSIILFFFVVENVGNGGRFLVSRAESVVVESSLLVEILQRNLILLMHVCCQEA